MKKVLSLFFIFILSVMLLCACIEQKHTQTEPSTDLQTQSELQPENNSCTISGSFTVSVREVIPDYCLDDSTPNVAVVTEFQSYPFTLFVGEEVGRELFNKQSSGPYVFTIEPIKVNRSKDEVKNMNLSSIVWEFPIKITKCRLAEENELGLESLQLTIE